ncbi:MAG: hypothetical protein KAX77_01300 [Xanthomonadales bacterium]|nr:hypothetical protein [Xanthomonadales bacterium]
MAKRTKPAAEAPAPDDMTPWEAARRDMLLRDRERRKTLRTKARSRERFVRAAAIVGAKKESIALGLGIGVRFLDSVYGDILAEGMEVQKVHAVAQLMAQSEEGQTKATELLLRAMDPERFGPVRDQGPPPVPVTLNLNYGPPPANVRTIDAPKAPKTLSITLDKDSVRVDS